MPSCGSGVGSLFAGWGYRRRAIGDLAKDRDIAVRAVTIRDRYEFDRRLGALRSSNHGKTVEAAFRGERLPEGIAILDPGIEPGE